MTQATKGPVLSLLVPAASDAEMAGRKEVWLGVAHVGTQSSWSPCQLSGPGWAGEPDSPWAPPILTVTIGLGLEGLQGSTAESGDPEASGSCPGKK